MDKLPTDVITKMQEFLCPRDAWNFSLTKREYRKDLKLFPLVRRHFAYLDDFLKQSFGIDEYHVTGSSLVSRLLGDTTWKPKDVDIVIHSGTFPYTFWYKGERYSCCAMQTYKAPAEFRIAIVRGVHKSYRDEWTQPIHTPPSYADYEITGQVAPEDIVFDLIYTRDIQALVDLFDLVACASYLGKTRLVIPEPHALFNKQTRLVRGNGTSANTDRLNKYTNRGFTIANVERIKRWYKYTVEINMLSIKWYYPESEEEFELITNVFRLKKRIGKVRRVIQTEAHNQRIEFFKLMIECEKWGILY